MSENKNQEKKFKGETRDALQSHDYKKIHIKIEELKTTGKVSILPYLLDLLNSDCPESIKQDVLIFTGDLKYQGGVPIIVDYIKNRKVGSYLSSLISCCWQSSLDFSEDIEVFADCFITEDYQTALESFTVIEEMLWKSKAETIEACRQMLNSRAKEVGNEKISLYQELIKLLYEGRKANSKDFPDLYMN